MHRDVDHQTKSAAENMETEASANVRDQLVGCSKIKPELAGDRTNKTVNGYTQGDLWRERYVPRKKKQGCRRSNILRKTRGEKARIMWENRRTVVRAVN